jgi:hypothetical protein
LKRTTSDGRDFDTLPPFSESPARAPCWLAAVRATTNASVERVFMRPFPIFDDGSFAALRDKTEMKIGRTREL